MSINVRFDKAGFYHPAFGRMGRGKNAGRVYTLPEFFAEEGKLPASATRTNICMLLNLSIVADNATNKCALGYFSALS